MNKWLSVLIGLILVVAPIVIAGLNLGGWGTATVEVLKGGVIIVIVLVGLLLLLLGISEIKG